MLKELNELLKCPQSQVMDPGGGLPGDALGKVGKLKRARGVCWSAVGQIMIDIILAKWL